MSTNEKKPRLINDRLNSLEELTAGIAGFVQNEIGALKTASTNIVEVINAIIEISGGEEFAKKVQEQIEAARRKRAEDQARQEQEAVAKAVADGILVAADTISESSIVVGREFDSDGNVIGSGRIQFRFSSFAEEARPKVLGQGVGFIVDGTNGKLEVMEIYEVAPQKAPEVTDGAAPEASKAE